MINYEWNLSGPFLVSYATYIPKEEQRGSREQDGGSLVVNTKMRLAEANYKGIKLWICTEQYVKKVFRGISFEV